MNTPASPPTDPVSLTPQQKLEALAARFYSFLAWVPKPGDYYTSARADLELYRVVKIEGGKVYTEYCTSPGNLADWPEAEFLEAGFGLMRVWVPDWILRDHSADAGKMVAPEPRAQHGWLLGRLREWLRVCERDHCGVDADLLRRSISAIENISGETSEPRCLKCGEVALYPHICESGQTPDSHSCCYAGPCDYKYRRSPEPCGEQFDPLKNFAEWCLGAPPEAPGMVQHIIDNARAALEQAAELRAREPRGELVQWILSEAAIPTDEWSRGYDAALRSVLRKLGYSETKDGRHE